MNRKFRKQQKAVFVEPTISENEKLQAKFIFAWLSSPSDPSIEQLFFNFEINSRKLMAKLYEHVWHLQNMQYRRQVIIQQVSELSPAAETLWHWWLYVRQQWLQPFPVATRLLQALALPDFKWDDVKVAVRLLDKTFSLYSANLLKQPPTTQRSWQKSCVSWFVEQTRKHFPRGTSEQILNPGYSPQNTILVNRFKTSRQNILKLFKAHKIRAVESKSCPNAIILLSKVPFSQMPFYETGLFDSWDEARQLLLVLSHPQDHQTIWDVEPGAGQNLLGLACLQSETGEIFISNMPESKKSKFQEKIDTYDIRNITWFDGTTAPSAGFDLVFLNQPGSQSGMIGDNPRLKIKGSEQEFQKVLIRQQERLNEVAPQVKTGGILAYSTESYFPEENDHQIEKFLALHPEFKVQRVAHPVLTNYPNACWTPHGFSTLPVIRKMKGIYLSLLQKQG